MQMIMRLGKIKKLVLVMCMLISFVLLVFTQTDQTDTNKSAVDSNQNTAKDQTLSERIMYFKSQVSSEDNDEVERKIVSVKRINLVLDSVENTPEKKKINEYVEIELFSSMKIPITNSSHYVRIGYQEFPVERWSGDMHTAFVRLTPNEFESLENDSYVSYRIGKKMDPKELKEYIEKGLLSEIAGPVFGRLNKDMINQHSTVEINNVQP